MDLPSGVTLEVKHDAFDAEGPGGVLHPKIGPNTRAILRKESVNITAWSGEKHCVGLPDITLEVYGSREDVRRIVESVVAALAVNP